MNAISFKQDVSPLFSDTDETCMLRHKVDLKSFAYMSDETGDDTFADHANARHVLARVKGDEVPQMPMHAPPWSGDKIATLNDWIDGGFSP